MRKLATAFVLGAMVLTAPALEARTKLTSQQRLDKILEGRTAGKPVNCISLMDSRDTQVIDKTAIVYGTGSVIYVNQPDNPAGLDSNDILVSNIRGSQLCNLDIVRLHDRSGGFFSGSVGLNQFVPYRKTAGTH